MICWLKKKRIIVKSIFMIFLYYFIISNMFCFLFFCLVRVVFLLMVEFVFYYRNNFGLSKMLLILCLYLFGKGVRLMWFEMY